MAKNNEFVSYLLEMLQEFGQVRAKAMFGGFGIYRNEFIFAIVVEVSSLWACGQLICDVIRNETNCEIGVVSNGRKLRS